MAGGRAEVGLGGFVKEFAATITRNGRVTLPSEVRRHLGVKEGDKITFVLGNEGLVQVRTTRYPTIASVAGAAGELDRPMAWKEMRDIAIEDRLAEKYPHDDV
jgi:AbrB family looped-hinge helix DNA binding protein